MIEVLNLCKAFGGRPAIKGVTFRVERGEILGFLGPNGAGKTTTMRVLTGYMPPDSGAARIAGFDVFEKPMEVKRRIGYLPETPPLYPEMTVRPYLDFVAKIRGVPRSQRRARLDSAIERCGLGSVAGRLIGNLSKGYRQRVGLAQAILHDPTVLILDEPTVGLDPEQIVEIRTLIRSLGGDHTVILSTHILPEVTVTCSRVAIISYGEIVQEGSLEGLAESGAEIEKVRVRVARGAERIGSALSGAPAVAGVTPGPAPDARVVELRRTEGAREQVAAAIVAAGLGLLEMTPITRTLEEVYLDATRRLPQADALGEPAPPAGGAPDRSGPDAAAVAPATAEGGAA